MQDSGLDVVVVGAGGHAAAVAELLDADSRYRVLGCVGPTVRRDLGVPWLGGDDILPSLYSQGTQHALIAVGDNALRASLAERLLEIGFRLITVVSSAAFVAPSARLGDGTVVMPGAVVGTAAYVMDNTIVNTGASVDHHASVGPSCHIAPGAHLAGGVQVGPGAFVGMGASILPNVTVGSRSVVGAGAVVTRNVPDRALVLGVPARVVKRFT
ncbi:MAG: acetyltransferase [Alicyclobacillus sp.]|nr:acetyltransferase [Alicyclobacillus sp.]